MRITLPDCPVPPASEPRIAILADDDEFFRIALSSILTGRLGYAEVFTAASLDAALELLAETPGVTLALFDLAMPGMASAASLAAVRECYPQVTAVVVSGSTRRDDVLLALKAGVHGFVPKAAGAEDLAQALAMIAAGWVYVPPFVTDVSARTPAAAPSRPAGKAAPARGAEPPGTPDVVLTPRQRQVLSLLVKGQSNKVIARSLGLGEGTVKIHVAALLKALNVPNRSAAAVYGAQYPEYGAAPAGDR